MVWFPGEFLNQGHQDLKTPLLIDPTKIGIGEAVTVGLRKSLARQDVLANPEMQPDIEIGKGMTGEE